MSTIIAHVFGYISARYYCSIYHYIYKELISNILDGGGWRDSLSNKELFLDLAW